MLFAFVRTLKEPNREKLVAMETDLIRTLSHAGKDAQLVSSIRTNDDICVFVFFSHPKRSAQLEAPVFSAGAELSVMTFNIWLNGGDSMYETARIIKSFGRECDVICLQEAHEASVAAIAILTGLYCAPKLGILSRHPIRPIDASFAAVGNVHVANVHLKAYPYPPYELTKQKALETESKVQLASLESYNLFEPISAGVGLKIIAGDFNIGSHLDEESYISRGKQNRDHVNYRGFLTHKRMAEMGFTDCYIASENQQGPRLTWTPRPEEEPHDIYDRIDFVYCKAGVLDFKVTNVQHICDDIPKWPSDHRAVLAKILILN